MTDQPRANDLRWSGDELRTSEICRFEIYGRVAKGTILKKKIDRLGSTKMLDAVISV